jgi:dipeptidyl aminopeptidase/acylaminoacyl peptidase
MTRHVIVALLCGFIAVSASGAAIAQETNHPDFHPRASLQHQDYVAARSRFRTKLLRIGPAPQGFKPLALPADATEVTYSSSPDQLKAWLFTPDTPGPHSAVLYLHGGHAFDSGDWDAAQPYRDAGFVVAAPILRGENGQPGTFSMYYDETDDVLAAIEYLRHLKSVDPHRIFVAGHSVGGTMTMLAALTSKHIRAAAAFSGSPDQLLYVSLAPGAKERAPFDYKDERELIMRSPLAFAAYFKCPLRIYYGSKEPEFEFTSEETARVARSSRKDVQVIVEPGNHKTHLPLSIEDSIKFFKGFP